MAAVAEAPGSVSWRTYRNCSPKQIEALDFITNSGQFKDRPTRTPFLLYGGAGGGGKSHLLRTAAVELLALYRDMGFPDQRVAIVCNTYPNLLDRQITKLKREFGHFAEVKRSQTEGLHVRFFGPGMENLGIIALRNMAQAYESSSKKGAEFAAILVDELTEFTQEQFGELIYMKRTSEGLPFSPFLGVTNPDGIGHDFVKRLWVPTYQDFSDFDQVIQDAKPSFHFIQALRGDNPTYVHNKESFDIAINAIEDPDVRRARDTGAWDIYVGGRFPQFRKSLHTFGYEDFLNRYGFEATGMLNKDRDEFMRVVKNHREHGFHLYSSFDYGSSQDSASAWYRYLVDWEGFVWCFGETYMIGMHLEPQARRLLPIVQEAPIHVKYCDPALKGKESESQDGLTRIEKFRRAGVSMVPAINDRIEGWASIDSALDFIQDRESQEIIQEPRLKIHTDCMHLIRFFQAGPPRDKVRKEDVSSEFKNDHSGDSLRYFIHTRFGKSARRKKPPAPGSVAALVNRAKEARAKARKEAEGWD